MSVSASILGQGFEILNKVFEIVVLKVQKLQGEGHLGGCNLDLVDEGKNTLLLCRTNELPHKRWILLHTENISE